MVPYISSPANSLDISGKTVYSFVTGEGNLDKKTVKSFGEEWKKFNYFSDEEIRLSGDEYFDIVPAGVLNSQTICLDVGCGTGRWTKYVCDKVKFVEAIDPSDSVYSAVELLRDKQNVRITQADVDNIPFPDNSFDFVFSLGVLHHIPDTLSAMKKSVAKLKPNGTFLVYLYYNLENRSVAYRSIFHVTNFIRKGISKLPSKAKKVVCDFIAGSVYMPFVGMGRMLIKLNQPKIARKLPLYYYTNKSWSVIRTDALDRFGTPLEQRFTKNQIRTMMEDSGLRNIVFSDRLPFWHAIGQKMQHSYS